MIKVNKNDLATAIGKCQKARRAQYINVKVENNLMTLTATSDYLGVITSLGCESDKTTEFVLDSEKFYPVISKALDDNITIEEAGSSVRIKAGKMDVSIHTSIIPVVSRKLEETEIRFRATVELDKITACAHALNYTIGDNKMSSYHLCFFSDGYSVTGMDGHRISYRKYGAGENTSDMIVSGKGISDVLSIMGKNPVTLMMGDRGFVQFENETDVVTVSCFAGSYYQIERVLTPTGQKFVMDKEELIDALSVTTIFGVKVLLEATPEKFRLLTEADNSGVSVVEVGYSTEVAEKPADIKICLNASHLIDALKAIDTDEVEMFIASNRAPVQIMAKDGVEVLCPFATL